MQIRGERFDIDLDEHDKGRASSSGVNAFDLIGDVKERSEPAIGGIPQAPQIKNDAGGFPVHRKRIALSRFKAQKASVAADETRTLVPPEAPLDEPVARDLPLSEKQQIDVENRDRLAHMSKDEIMEARQEIMASMNPATLERLLRRSHIGDAAEHADFPGVELDETPAPLEPRAKKATKKVAFASDVSTSEDISGAQDKVKSEHSEITTTAPAEHLTKVVDAQPESIHWPRPSQPPDLDPSSSSFLDDLHSKYFPSLPAEPEKLEWMQSTGSASYGADQHGMDPKEVRFDFHGALIPPRLAAEIPVTQGLHHHGEAPDAAGYTIAELGLLARSTVAAQRCIAFQTLGRILYRLGRGEFGDPSKRATSADDDNDLSELAKGLWHEAESATIVDICIAESEGHSVCGGNHTSAKAYATEAVWLWQKGGGRRWKAA